MIEQPTGRVTGGGLNLLHSILDELAEPSQSLIPLLRNQVQVTAGIIQASQVQLPDALTSVPCAAQQARCLHDAQMFGDRLASDFGSRCEPGNGHWSGVTEARDQP